MTLDYGPGPDEPRPPDRWTVAFVALCCVVMLAVVAVLCVSLRGMP